MVHGVVRLPRTTHEVRAAERFQQRRGIVVIAGDQMHRKREAADHLTQCRVLVRTPPVDQVAGDDDAVRLGIEREHAAERAAQPCCRCTGKRTGRHVRITEMCDRNGHDRTFPAASAEQPITLTAKRPTGPL
jgi:hypothetical protein